MTNQFTQDELLAIIEQAEQDVTIPPVQYKLPDLRSQEFSKVIDHTYLKLDAGSEQIDQLAMKPEDMISRYVLKWSEE